MFYKLKVFFTFILLPHFCFSSSLSSLVEPVVPTGHTGSIYATAFSKDGRLAFSLAEDQSLRVWEVDSGREVKKYKMISDHVKALAVSPNGYWVVTGDENKGLKLWDVATGKKIQRFKGHDRQVNSLAFSADGKLLLSAGNDKKIRIWDIKNAKLIRELRGHKKKINRAIFSADGKYIASASDDKQIILWDAKTGQKIKQFMAHKKAVKSLDFSADSSLLLSAGQDKQIILWDIKTGKKIRTYNGHQKNINSVVFSPDGKTILSASDDFSIRLWDNKTAKQIQLFKGHTKRVLGAIFSPDGKLILSGSKDQTLRLWGSQYANQIRIFRGLASRLNSISVSADGSYLLSAHNDRTLKLWDMKNGQNIRIFSRHGQRVNDVTFSNKGKYAASASSDQQIIVWNIDSGRRLRRFKGHTASVNQVLFTPSGKQVLSASADRTIRLWNVRANQQEKLFSGHSRSVLAIAIHPQGKSFVSSSKDKTIRLWDITSGKSQVIAKTDYPVRNLKYTADGKYIISSGWKLLKLDSKTGKQIFDFGQNKQSHQGDISALALSVDGKLLASGSYDNKIKLWDIDTGKLQSEFNVPYAGILSLIFLADNNRLLSAGGDGVIRLWDLQQQQESLRMVGSSNGEWITMTPDGYYDHSPEGNNLIHWVNKQGINSYSFEQFEDFFRRPEIIQARLTGNTEAGATPPDMGKPPRIEFADHLRTKIINTDYINLNLKVIDDKQIETLRIFVNGKMVLNSSIKQKEKQLQLKIPLNSGANQITALTYNSTGLSSDPRYLSVLSNQPRKEKSTLHIFSIGVSKYKNLDENSQLNYAHSDAQNFVKRFNHSSNSLYKEVKSYYLLNELADQKTVLQKLKQLTSQVSENDVLMIFFAGHGFKDTDKQEKETFYLATHDLKLQQMSTTSINWQHLSEVLHQVKGRVIMFLDACHSGSISNETIVPNNELAQQLFNNQRGGIMVFSAAKGRQYAGESASFGQGEGLFSYAISKVLSNNGIDADNNGNGYIEISEMVEHVQSFVDNKSEGQQTPWLSHKELFGDLPIAKVLPAIN